MVFRLEFLCTYLHISRSEGTQLRSYKSEVRS